MRHKVKVFTGGFDFIGTPSGITASAPISINVAAVSTGRAIGGSGTRIWDTAAVPATTTVAVPSGGQFLYPLISTNLPAYYFDAIIVVNTDGVRNPVAFSNAPANKAAYPADVPPSEKSLFWTDLYCYGTGNALGSNTAANHYMFGGRPRQSGGGDSPIDIHFQEPTTVPVTVNWSYRFYAYSGGAIGPVTTGSASVPAGTLDQRLVNDYNGIGILGGAIGFGAAYATEGFWQLSLSVSDPSFRSMLPFYHWGQFGTP
jgi:hypothetical protein